MCDRLKTVLNSFEDEPVTSVLSSVEKNYSGTVVWSVQSSLIREKTDEDSFVESRLFSLGSDNHLKFTIRLSVSQSEENKYVDVFLKLCEVRIGMIVFGNFKIIGEDGTSLNTMDFCVESPRINLISVLKFLDYERLEGYLTEDQKLILNCNINMRSAEFNAKYESSESSVTYNCPPAKSNEFLFRHPKFSNVNFVLKKDDSKSISAHREIVESKIPVIRSIIRSSQVILNSYEIENIDENMFVELLEYAYTGSLNLKNFEHAYEVYVAADDFLMLDLRNLCSTYLALHINEETRAFLELLGSSRNDEFLQRACDEYKKVPHYED